MTQLLGAKELHSIVTHSLLIYDYAYDTEFDHLVLDHFQDPLVHYLLNIK
jgi:hypothetical protein